MENRKAYWRIERWDSRYSLREVGSSLGDKRSIWDRELEKFNRGAATCAIPLKNNKKVLAYPPQAGYVRAGIIEVEKELKKFNRSL